MKEEERTLVERAVARLVSRFSMTRIPLEQSARGAGERYRSRRYPLELRLQHELGLLALNSHSGDGSNWELTLRGIGSTRNWFTAEIAASDQLDDAALDLLHEIDLALDGLVRQALLARQMMLARRRDALVRMSRAILAEHAALQRLDHRLDRHARQHNRPAIMEVFDHEGGLRDHWLAVPGNTPPGWRSVELANAGSPHEGYRFYLECVMHASSAEEAAQYLAGELAGALHDGQLSASIEPIDTFGSFIDEQLRLFVDVVLDARAGAGSPAAPAAPSIQIAMERLGA